MDLLDTQRGVLGHPRFQVDEAAGGDYGAIRAGTHVVHQRPGPVERRGPQIIGIPPDDVARRVAHAATDAFDRRVDGEAPR